MGNSNPPRVTRIPERNVFQADEGVNVLQPFKYAPVISPADIEDMRRRERGEALAFRRMFLNDWKFPSAELYALAEEACFRYDRRCDRSEDPMCPQRSRPDRPTFIEIRRKEIDAFYPEALRLDFEGDMYAWHRFVYDRRPHGERFKDPWKGHSLEATQQL